MMDLEDLYKCFADLKTDRLKKLISEIMEIENPLDFCNMKITKRELDRLKAYLTQQGFEETDKAKLLKIISQLPAKPATDQEFI